MIVRMGVAHSCFRTRLVTHCGSLALALNSLGCSSGYHQPRHLSASGETTGLADHAPRAASITPNDLVQSPAAFWNASTVYFLLTDRFLNGDRSNDDPERGSHKASILRGFEGGDLAGVRQKIEEGYFQQLGVNVLWLTPFVEQIQGSVNEGTGRTFGYHGYWARDFTRVDPALGTFADLENLVRAAHERRIRVMMDAVLNHTGPVTREDPKWPPNWVRTGPRCLFRDYASTTTCTLVDNLPDIRTETDSPVELPPALVEKWQREGRLEREREELAVFFARTGYPKAPRYYLIKWLTDWVRELGIDAFRVDTAKHFEASVGAALKHEAEIAFLDWKRAHRSEALDDLPFFMMGEVYGWDPRHGREFDYGDRRVDFFSYGYDGLISFGFKQPSPLEQVYSTYAELLHTTLQGKSILSYVSSHDDESPFDRDRRDPVGAGTRLLLTPGSAIIYYGDEIARPLRVPGAMGDASLRSMMRWTDAAPGAPTTEILAHWEKLGRFRRAHPAVGAGEHRRIQESPYVFSRQLELGGHVDRVVVALVSGNGVVEIPVGGAFPDGTRLIDGYSGARSEVKEGRVPIVSPHGMVLWSDEWTGG
jgi:alpha-amylase